MPVSNSMMGHIRECKLDAVCYDDSANKTDREVAQAVINEAWNKFDPEDISGLELDRPYLIMHRYGISDARLEDWEGDISWHNDEGLPFGKVTHYANPNDLLYVQKQEKTK